jgi:DNA-binding response OmpR family regulator
MSDHARILLVEDHHDTAVVVRFVLEQRGYEVLSASSCGEACTCVESVPVDLLICDIGLPDGSGLDLVRRLTLDRSLPAIAVSGFGTADDIRRSLDAGFIEHITKPFGMSSLIAAVERALL